MSDLNAAKIKAALAVVHANECSTLKPWGVSRVEAARDALRVLRLTEGERAILLSALHVSESELA